MRRWYALLIFAIAVAVYFPLAQAGFQEDDFTLIRRVQLHGPFGTWTWPGSQFFRPLISVSFWAQDRLSGDHAGPFRLLNFGLHGLNAVLLFGIVRQLLRRSDEGAEAAAIAALLFAVHPSHVEPVAWIAARTDLFATAFGLTSLYAVLRYAEAPKMAWAVLAAISLFLGFLSKESVLTVPIIAWAFVAIVRPPEITKKRLPPLLIGVGISILAYVALRFSQLGTFWQGDLGRSSGVKLLATTAAQFTRILLPGLPFGDPLGNNTETASSIPGLVMIGLAGSLVLVGVWRSRSTDSASAAELRFLAIAGLVALLPAVGLSVRLFRSQGERFLYFPSAFLLAWLVAVCVLNAKGRLRDLAAPWIAMMASLFALQWQSRYWIAGASVASGIEATIARHVVPAKPPQAKRIVLLGLPVRVQGAYTAVYVVGEIARKHGLDTVTDVQPLGMFSIRQANVPVESRTVGAELCLTVANRDGRADAEDSLRETSPGMSPLLRVEPNALVYDLERFGPNDAVFVWDGRQLRPLAVR